MCVVRDASARRHVSAVHTCVGIIVAQSDRALIKRAPVLKQTVFVKRTHNKTMRFQMLDASLRYVLKCSYTGTFICFYKC